MSRFALSRILPAHRRKLARPLRRLTLELFAVVALKVAALTVIWWVVFAPQPRPDASPTAIAERLAPANSAAQEPHP
ncbi:MAG: cytochrome oxidase putative small subunit CydP [Rhodanobacter sp.]